jgi:hypothetical protein
MGFFQAVRSAKRAARRSPWPGVEASRDAQGEPCTRSTTPCTRRSDLRRRPSDPGENPLPGARLRYGPLAARLRVSG